VNDAVAVVLERRTDVVFRLGPQPAAGLGALRRPGREHLAFASLESLTNAGH
jgi:hypothetical protein